MNSNCSAVVASSPAIRSHKKKVPPPEMVSSEGADRGEGAEDGDYAEEAEEGKGDDHDDEEEDEEDDLWCSFCLDDPTFRLCA